MYWRRVLLVLTAAAAALAGWRLPPSAATRAGWLKDYELLRTQTGAAYANLGARLRARRLSPRRLDEATRAALSRSRDADEARAALLAFAAAFDDNHFKVRAQPGWLTRTWQRIAGAALPLDHDPLPLSLSGDAACARLGYRDRDRGTIGWTALPGFHPSGGGTAERPFLAGLLPAEGDRPRTALLRIPLFSGEGYPALCAAEWARLRAARTAPCDAGCREDFELAVEFALADRLATQVEELARAGATALVVDITGNGGGSSVVDPLARELTPVPLRGPDLGFIRHPHWEGQFAQARDDFARELARPDLLAAQQALLVRARDQAEAMRREAARRCDLSGLWSQDAPALPCDPLGRFAGYLKYARPGELAGLKTGVHLFGPSQYRYREGAWRGRLIVLIDGWTASASEEFAAMLKDNGAATLAGQHTLGIGCGYTNGGVRLTLPRLHVEVRMPDCVRYRADGRSEAEGVDPDIPVPWVASDDPLARARKVLAALSR